MDSISISAYFSTIDIFAAYTHRFRVAQVECVMVPCSVKSTYETTIVDQFPHLDKRFEEIISDLLSSDPWERRRSLLPPKQTSASNTDTLLSSTQHRYNPSPRSDHNCGPPEYLGSFFFTCMFVSMYARA